MRRTTDADRAANAQDPVVALRRLLGYLKPYRLQVLVVIILVVISAGLTVLGPYLMGVAIDDYIMAGDMAGLTEIVLAMLATYVVMWLAGVGYGRLMAKVAQRALQNMRQDLFEHMQTLSLSFYDKQSAGDLMSRLTNDMENINLLLSQNLVQFISSIVTLVAVVVAMFALNVWLALVTLLVVPIMFLFLGVLMKRLGPAFRVQQKSLGELNGLMEENLSGQRVIIAYNRQGDSLDDFETANETAREAGTRAQILAGLMFPITMGLSNLSIAVVVGIGAWMAVNDIAGVTVGLITTYTGYTRRFNQPLTQIANLFSSIVAALAGAERIFEVMDTEPQVVDKANAPALQKVQGDVIFQDVDFSYLPGVPILKDIDLAAQPGQTIALVGPTGAGKTTMVNVLSRFYDIEDGHITIDGSEIRDVQQDSLRKQLGIVLQDTYLFADTVLENIRYGNLRSTDDEVFAAARLANAHEFIIRLPEGYDTVLSERAGNISQGQRQMLAIARAILAEPRILVLDEATSSVDTRTEQQIQEAFLKLMEGRTSFVIAHRLSTIRNADQILVVDDGQIIERGTHESLLADKGFYYNMYTSQFKGTAVAV